MPKRTTSGRQRFTLHASRFTKDVYAVILVGGKGKRLRPLSTGAKPKAFLSVTADRKTIFRRTVERMSRLVPGRNIMVVANKAHAGLVSKDFPGIRRNNLLLEPAPKNTAPAIALAALALEGTAGDATMVVVPSDHYITREAAYLKTLREAVSFVKKDRSSIVTFGIRPTFPATGYGYIKLKAPRPARSTSRGGQSSPARMGHEPGRAKLKGICKVERFTEKPDVRTAERFVKSGQYLWNAGIFVFNSGEILKAFMDLAPDIWRALNGGRGKGSMGPAYRNLPDISMDYAVMEKAGGIYCARGSFGWKDIGSFGALKEILLLERRRFIEKGGKVTKIL